MDREERLRIRHEFWDTVLRLPRQGPGKHAAGTRKPSGYHDTLKLKRKRERHARRRAR